MLLPTWRRKHYHRIRGKNMKYTFIHPKTGKEKTVNIPDEYIKVNKHNLGISTKDAIYMYLSDEGYISNTVVDELTKKAKGSGVKAEGKTRKAPTRKPDYIKRSLVSEIAEHLKTIEHIAVEDSTAEISNVEVTNIERIVAFTIGNDKYEITLSKKRAPKK